MIVSDLNHIESVDSSQIIGGQNKKGKGKDKDEDKYKKKYKCYKCYDCYKD
ncbi:MULTISPECIES: hypothetical protein [Fischerella]|uniref:hypothetical protein n=1 Tax=Fischerella TaxID=1190 RepID=UPI0002D57017|nr:MULTISPECIES: hypothetical protein [Fischerella]